MGIPMQLEIKRAEAEDTYRLYLKELLWQPLDTSKQAPTTLKHTGDRTALWQDLPPPIPPISLWLSRMRPESSANVIREDSYTVPPYPESNFNSCKLKWSFERQ